MSGFKSKSRSQTRLVTLQLSTMVIQSEEDVELTLLKKNKISNEDEIDTKCGFWKFQVWELKLRN